MNKRKFDDFDPFADNYRDLHNDSIKISGEESNYFTKQKIEIISTNFNEKNIKFLDFGCGDGNSEKFFYDFFPTSKYFGIDISEKSINIGIKSKNENSNFSLFDGEKIPYEDNFFDIIIAANVFHHIDFKLHEVLFSEIYRVLKPTGHFYLFEHNPFNPITRFIVKTCAFDKDAKLLFPRYSKSTLKKLEFKTVKSNFILFFPRIIFFKYFIKLEDYLKKIPLGAQYYTLCIK